MADFVNIVRKNLIDSSNLLQMSSSLAEQTTEFALAIIRSLDAGGKILLAGNGGSAADAQHMAAEFVNYFNFPRPGLPAISLSTDTSIMTSVSNDTSYDLVYSRQIEALANKGDIFWCYTTSGKSKNIIEAVRVANQMGVVVCAFTGSHVADLQEFCTYIINVPSKSTPRIQESHLVLGHSVAEIVERHYFGEQN